MSFVVPFIAGKRQERVRARRYYWWVNPLEAPPQRVLIDGKEYLVRRIVNMTDTEVMVEGVDGTITVIPRKKNPAVEEEKSSK